MASFEVAFKKTARNEAGWVNNPNDSGKETYNGISRKFHPSWKGWIIIDAMKQQPNFPTNLKQRSSELYPLEKEFYRINFWNPIWGDKIQKQEVANTVYDFGVNAGVSVTIKINEDNFGLRKTGKMSAELLYKLNSIR